jgi:cullin 1
MELILSTFQAAVLMLFNDHSTLKFEEMQSKLQIPEDDLSRALYSLSCAKHMILTKASEGKQINSGDSFTLNTSFSDKMRKIKVPLPAQEDKKKVHEEVDKDREYLMDAAIVRIMKSRKQMHHHQLVHEVVQQLNKTFSPVPKQIKKRLEVLQEREYIERDADDPSRYKYLA